MDSDMPLLRQALTDFVAQTGLTGTNLDSSVSNLWAVKIQLEQSMGKTATEREYLEWLQMSLCLATTMLTGADLLEMGTKFIQDEWKFQLTWYENSSPSNFHEDHPSIEEAEQSHTLLKPGNDSGDGNDKGEGNDQIPEMANQVIKASDGTALAGLTKSCADTELDLSKTGSFCLSDILPRSEDNQEVIEEYREDHSSPLQTFCLVETVDKCNQQVPMSDLCNRIESVRTTSSPTHLTWPVSRQANHKMSLSHKKNHFILWRHTLKRGVYSTNFRQETRPRADKLSLPTGESNQLSTPSFSTSAVSNQHGISTDTGKNFFSFHVIRHEKSFCVEVMEGEKSLPDPSSSSLGEISKTLSLEERPEPLNWHKKYMLSFPHTHSRKSAGKRCTQAGMAGTTPATSSHKSSLRSARRRRQAFMPWSLRKLLYHLNRRRSYPMGQEYQTRQTLKENFHCLAES